MIGQLRGSVVSRQPPWLVLDVAGVGYEMEAPTSCFAALPDEAGEIILYTHFVMRQDAQLLYAFTGVAERDVFRRLLKVNGVGPKVALAILSTMTATDLLVCLDNENVAQLTRVPGLGKKTAQRLIVDLKGKLVGFGEQQEGDRVSVMPARTEAVQALQSLGYSSSEAEQAVRAVPGKNLTDAELLRGALQGMRQAKA
ncbi:MAG TPA: Holliday junction branch migration protein RuvA [Gammaproteobacteria bacterium]|nr:Holliday junction branch migration protein RuvA [Gammaproteobacteria bacterium]